MSSTTPRQILNVDHDAQTVTFDKDVEIEPLGDGYRVSAPWYDGCFITTSESSFMVGDAEVNLNDLVRAELDAKNVGRAHKAPEFPA